MGAGSKVIAMPEEQYVGALERAAERLSAEVESALRALERQRDLKARADEVISGPAGRARARALEGGAMAFGIGEPPERSLAAHLESVEYPAAREDLVQAAGDSEAPAEVINFLKSLPRERYENEEMVLRDIAEAARRFGTGGRAPLTGSSDRRNLGRDVVEENPDGHSRHP